MPDHDRLSIVVLNWNGLADLKDCLLSLASQTCTEYKLILVDNGSTDGSVEFVSQNYLQCRLIRNERNVGYCAGMNQGIRASRGEFVWLLNNDLVLRREAVEQMLRAWESAGSKVIGLFPKVMRYDNPAVFDSFGFRWDRLGFVQSDVPGQVDRGQYDEPRRIMGDLFVAPCFRREALLSIGAFDEDFFTYAEDFDVSYRANLAGYTLQTAPKVVVYHKGGQTSVRNQLTFLRRARWSIRNYLMVLIENYELGNLLLFLPVAIARIWVYHGMLGALRQGFPLREIVSTHSGIARDLIQMLPQVWDKRRAIQRMRVLSDREIWSIGC